VIPDVAPEVPSATGTTNPFGSRSLEDRPTGSIPGPERLPRESSTGEDAAAEAETHQVEVIPIERVAGPHQSLIDTASPVEIPEVAPSGPKAGQSTSVAASREYRRLRPGTKVQHYELIRELGRGGMGSVFLARDLKLGRRVAIKFLSARSPEFTERFLVEARATARCNHENIVVIHEFNLHEGQPFMVLEYLEGESLRSVMAGRRLSPFRAVEILVPVVRALQRAHEHEIVHRDLKPDNVFVLSSGGIKVLDFGIAKLFTAEERDRSRSPIPEPRATDLEALSASPHITRDGIVVGTVHYMSPEQWGVDEVDHRTDLWAVGLILSSLLTGKHPLADLDAKAVKARVTDIAHPLPSVGASMPGLPLALVQVVDRCLAKRKAERYGSARELLADLEPLLPGRESRALAHDECPFPGLTAFQEADATRFFGRTAEVSRAVARIRDQPLVGVVGPSGVGKSSFLRAGVVPALKAAGEDWEVFHCRPGRTPILTLARTLQPVDRSSGVNVEESIDDVAELASRIFTEPGKVGALLRARLRRKRLHILLLVDQLEELYTLGADVVERQAYVAALAAVADDPATPLRVVVSMRSDFLERLAESPAFLEELTRGLLFLQPPDRAGLREALVRPIALTGHRFEKDELVDTMLDALGQTPAALPLLQFTAAKLWDSRSIRTRTLTEVSYLAMGGIAGALATHADAVLAGLSPADQRLAQQVLTQLVTPDGTRAVVDLAELRERSRSPGEVGRVIDYLVQGRLLAAQTRGEGDGASVEIVHESLITRWPTLRRWLDKGQEDAAFLDHLRHAARQWEAKGRPLGLLWRDEAMEEARLWRRRYQGELRSAERAFLDAVFALAEGAARRRRYLVIGAFGVLLALIAAAAVALLWIREAEQQARVQAHLARRAEAKVKGQLQVIQNKERERAQAERAARTAQAKVATGERVLQTTQAELKMSYGELQRALSKAREESARAQQEKVRAEAASRQAGQAAAEAEKARQTAERAARAEREARTKLELLLAREQERVRRLVEERRKITTELK
jgi:serine/threonine protein kinase